jgi:DNA-binding MarR family transcriptional regulator
MKYQTAAVASRRSQTPGGKANRHSNREPTRRAAGAADSEASIQVAEANDLLMSIVRDLLYVEDRTSNLPLRQLRVCARLYDGALSMSQLSRRMGVSLSAMTQIADRLERAGLVTRVANGPDRRVRCLTLTASGRRAMRAREKARLAKLSAAFDRMNDKSRADLIEGLRSFQEACASIANQSRESA